MDTLNEIKFLLRTCMQCGTCTASCPNAAAMDMTPRKMWRLLLMDRDESVLQSTTFALCSTCYTCTLRCPRDLPLTRVMSLLKSHALHHDEPGFKKSGNFYKSFMESVRRHGRVREGEFMALYFMAMKNPLLPLEFSGIGWQLMKKQKVKMQLPSSGDEKNLDALFETVRQIEERS